MSRDWWANQIGTAAAVTTPPGSLTQYSLATDIGTAPWPDAYSFNRFAEDALLQSQREKLARLEAQREAEKQGWFQRSLGQTIGGAVGMFSSVLKGDMPNLRGFGAYGGKREEIDRLTAEGGETMEAIGDLPGFKQVGQAWSTAMAVMETPFIASAGAFQASDEDDFDFWWFAKPTTWSQAWRAAEDRTLGEAVLDWFLSGQDPTKSQKDLDRMKRTNSLYGMASFGLDLGLGWKLDPTVVTARGVGEALDIRAGRLPRENQGKVRAEADRVMRGQTPDTSSLAGRYGAWRGRRVASNWDELRDAALSWHTGDFYNMPMFRARNSTNGAAAAEMLRIAAQDDQLWDLTKRAINADVDAWETIRLMKEGDLQSIPGGRTYLDALDAQKGQHTQLEAELHDLERLISQRQGPDGAPLKDGFYEYYNKELHATYEQKLADLADLETRLDQYEDYSSWLDMVPTFDNPGTSLSAVKVKEARFDHLSQRTYQKSIFGSAHTISEVSKAGYLKEANVIDLHHVDSGVQSIRRQFEQFQHYWGYENPEALDDVLQRFTRAQQRGDLRGAAMIAKEVEEQHLVGAIASRYDFDPGTVTEFLNKLRDRQGDMANALLSGEGTVYTTVPGQGARLVKRDQLGNALVEITEGKRKFTLKVPAEAVDGLKDTANLAVDPTQTPNFYSPLNHYRLHRAIEHDADLFRELDSAVKSRGRDAAKATFEAIDKYGSAWNQFWKPFQLFRLAWPQRVIMDETLRSMALVGVSSWARNHGAAMRDASLNAINPLEHSTLTSGTAMLSGAVAGGMVGGPVGMLGGAVAGATLGHRFAPSSIMRRRSLKIGPGPLSDEVTGRSINTAAHDKLMDETPFVPASFAPRVSRKRAEQVGKLKRIIDSNRERNIRISQIARARWREDMSRRAAETHARTGAPGKPPVVHTTSKYVEDAHRAIMGNREGRQGGDLPINRALYLWRSQRAGWRAGDADATTPIAPFRVLDPVMGKPVKSGYAVPIVSKDLRFDPLETTFMNDPVDGTPTALLGPEYDLDNFISENADLLSSQGYRVMIEEVPTWVDDGLGGKKYSDQHYRAHIVRVFNYTEKNKAEVQRKAVQFTGHAGADRFIDIGDGHKEYLRDYSDRTPVTEALERRFRTGEEYDFIPGESPAKGVEPVYHGSATGLPDELAPREEVPVSRGNMFGPGFYTTVDRMLAETYSSRGLYTIRGAKDGRTYEVFDLEQTVTQADRDELLEYLIEKKNDLAARIERGEYDNNGYTDQWGSYRNSDIEELEYQINQLDWNLVEGTTWVYLYQQYPFPYGRAEARIDALTTRFLEERRNAGALTHIGGVFTGGSRHQVYIWLHPEDLIVRPAYDKTGKYYSAEEWFDNPEAQEILELGWDSNAVGVTSRTELQVRNEVPESRIHRTGKKPRARARQANENLAVAEREAIDPDVEMDFDLDLELDDIGQRFLRKLFRRREYGRGNVSMRDRDGNRITVPDAFEGAGEAYIPLISGAPAYARLTDAYKRTLSMFQGKAVGYKRLPPPDVSPEALGTKAGRVEAIEYYSKWADLLNDQVRNSPIWYRMLQGQTDDQIIDWLQNSAAGAKIRKELPHKGYDPVRWVEEHRQALDHYLPREDLQALLRDRKINPSELRRIERERMPEVFGPDLEMIEGKTGFGRAMHSVVEQTYHALGTVPTDTLVRQPFFRAVYDLKLKNLVAATDADKVTDELLQAYAKRAREFALKEVKRTMYQLADDTNMTQYLRFMAPFWGAQYEAMVKWGGILMDRPEMMARYFMGNAAAYNQFAVVDEEGQPVSGPDGDWRGFGNNPNHRITFQVPKALQEMEPFKTMLAEQVGIGVAFGSLNVILQGDKPFLPGLGPLLSVPADQMLNRLWEDQGTQFDNNFFYRWLFPVGRPPRGGIDGYLEYIMPGWARRMSQLSNGEDNRTYANTLFSVAREMERDHKERGLPPPTKKEIQEATNWHFGLRVLASFAMPVAMEFRPRNQFYLDEYHRMQKQFGPMRAFEKFVEKHGADAARYATSSSSAIGVPPTRVGMKEWTQNDELIQWVAETMEKPDLVSLIMSPDAWEDEFSSDAYSSQFALELGPGSTTPLREHEGLDERFNETDARLGWLEYRKFMSAVNAVLASRGLTSITQTQAADLKALKDAKVSELRQQYPAWGRAMETFSDSIYSTVDVLREVAADPRFDNRPDFQGLRQYLLIRDQVAVELDNYALRTGGSRSLQAEENTALRNWFYAQVGQLVLDNPAFGELYTRYLDSDTLERGSGQ